MKTMLRVVVHKRLLTSPNRHDNDDESAKSEPVTVMLMPPASDAAVGNTEVTTGGSEKWKAVEVGEKSIPLFDTCTGATPTW